MGKGIFSDEVLVLRVQDWQAVDRYAVCYAREHGRFAFISYGARQQRSSVGHLVQPFAVLQGEFTEGKRVDTLRSCELVAEGAPSDITYIAYASIIAEATEQLTGEKEPAEDIYAMLRSALALLTRRNKEIVTLSALLKLLSFTGFRPISQQCTTCGAQVEEEGYFSLAQGGYLCKDCATGKELIFSKGTAGLLTHLLELDYQNPGSFTVRSSHLRQLGQIVSEFITYQTGRPLRSLNFLAQLKS